MFRDFLLFSVQHTILISPRQFHLGTRLRLTHFTHTLIETTIRMDKKWGITTYQKGPERTETDRNGPKRTYENTETDFYGYRNGPERTSVGTKTDRNRLQLIPRNELQWEPEKVGWGSIGTILIKICMYW